MNSRMWFVAVLAVLVAGVSQVAMAQQTEPKPMSFFVTSVGLGDGANLGGLAGADAHCQSLAAAVDRGNSTWHAYLSAESSHARDRIGSGPWYANGGLRLVATNVLTLHGDTIELAQLGNALGKVISMTENGDKVNGVGDSPNQHDILTGSSPAGWYLPGSTCEDWTSNASTGVAQLGHSDKQGGNNGSWNSSHPSRGCGQEDLVATGGAGLFYCFATN